MRAPGPFSTRTGLIVGGAWIPPKRPEYAQAVSRSTARAGRLYRIREWMATLAFALTVAAALAAFIVRVFP